MPASPPKPSFLPRPQQWRGEAAAAATHTRTHKLNTSPTHDSSVEPVWAGQGTHEWFTDGVIVLHIRLEMLRQLPLRPVELVNAFLFAQPHLELGTFSVDIRFPKDAVLAVLVLVAGVRLAAAATTLR